MRRPRCARPSGGAPAAGRSARGGGKRQDEQVFAARVVPGGCRRHLERDRHAGQRPAAGRRPAARPVLVCGVTDRPAPDPAAGLQGRHQLRAGRRHRDRQAGQSGGGPEAVRLPGPRGRQGPADPDVPADPRRAARPGGRGAESARPHAQPVRVGDTGRQGQRAAGDDLPRRLPRAPRQLDEGPGAAREVRGAGPGADGSRRRDVPADAGEQPVVHAEPPGGRERHRALRRPEVQLPADEQLRGAVRGPADHRRRGHPQPGVAVGAQGPGDLPRFAAGRPQGGHSGQRGVLGLPAAAVAESGRHGAGYR